MRTLPRKLNTEIISTEHWNKNGIKAFAFSIIGIIFAVYLIGNNQTQKTMDINIIKAHNYGGETIFRIEEYHHANGGHYKWAVATDERTRCGQRTNWHLFETKPLAQQFIDNFVTTFTLGG